MTDIIMEAREVTKDFGDFKAVDNLNLKINLISYIFYKVLVLILIRNSSYSFDSLMNGSLILLIFNIKLFLFK